MQLNPKPRSTRKDEPLTVPNTYNKLSLERKERHLHTSEEVKRCSTDGPLPAVWQCWFESHLFGQMLLLVVLRLTPHSPFSAQKLCSCDRGSTARQECQRGHFEILGQAEAKVLGLRRAPSSSNMTLAAADST